MQYTAKELLETWTIIEVAMLTRQGDPDFLPLPVEEYKIHKDRVMWIFEELYREAESRSYH